MSSALERSIIDAMFTMYASGVGTSKIAHQLNIRRETVWRYLRNAGILQPRRKVHRVSPMAAKTLYSLGHRPNEIAHLLGLSRVTVWRHLRDGEDKVIIQTVRKIAA